MDVYWHLPPPDLKLLAGQLHIWRVAQDVPAASLGVYWPLLSADEQARAARFRFDRDRTFYIVARGVLRILLGRYLSLAPEGIAFVYSPYDKPALAAEISRGLSFNVSHSGGVALLVFGYEAVVGIDVEKQRPLPDGSQIARHYFSQHENNIFHSLPAAQQNEAFFNCWTRKEAYIKAIGEGLSCPLDLFDVTLAPGEPARLLRIRGDEQAAAAWSLYSFAPQAGYTAALAAVGRHWHLSFWQWPGIV